MVFGQEQIKQLQPRQVGFQFPLGIRWCSDGANQEGGDYDYWNFNSPWELDGVRTIS